MGMLSHLVYLILYQLNKGITELRGVKSINCQNAITISQKEICHLFIVFSTVTRCAELRFAILFMYVFHLSFWCEKEKDREVFVDPFLGVPTHSNSWAHLFNKQNRHNAGFVQIIG